MEERFRFIEDLGTQNWTMAELCRHYGVTRATGYKWVERYEAGGLEGLREQSRAAKHHPNQIEPAIETLILGLRDKHPTWGAPKIRARLGTDHPHLKLPAESTIGAILQRNGLTIPQKRRLRSRPSEGPLEAPQAANQIWSADFKGWFCTRDGERIDPLTITDNFSRYLFRCQSLPAADALHAKPVFEAAFREFGLPARLRTDNGAPFASNGESGLTRLSAWWIALGIIPERIEPGKPQQNGRHERMHRTLKKETASPPAANRRCQQKRFDDFRASYNEQRPHQALGQQTPASCYQASPRPYPERIQGPEYASGWEKRMVCAGGQIRWRSGKLFVAHALHNQQVGLEPIDEKLWRVWYYGYEIGTFCEDKLQIKRPSPKPVKEGA